MAFQPLAQPWNDVPVLGPIAVAITGLTTVASPVLGGDPVRHGVLFHNPGVQNKRVLPAGTALVGGAGGILIYPGESYMLLQDDLTDYNVNCAWNAVTDNNADGALTIFNFTDANPAVTSAPAPTMRQNHVIPLSSPTAAQISTLGTASIPILGADVNRRGVAFHNPGTIPAAVCPANLAAVYGAGSLIILPGETHTLKGNRRVKINCAWNGIAQSGANNSLTMLGLYG